MDRETIRRWGLVWLILALLPAAFVALRWLLPPIGGGAAPPPAPVAPPGPVGSASCAACHPREHAAWASSTHAGAERAVSAADVGLADGQLTLEGATGSVTLAAVRAIGVEPLVQYLVPGERGRLQVSQRAWDPAERVWFDVFDDGRRPGEWGHWTGGGMTWNTQCASCHVTGVRRGYDASTDTFDTRFDELGVGCAACHGELDAHGAHAGPPPVGTEACAGCHARRAELVEGADPASPVLDRFAPQLVDGTDTFWPDGQVRDEDFEYTAFVGSDMHAAGVGCTGCHDPHTGGRIAEGDALCLRCHEALPGFVAHDPHPAGADVGCVGCHMPVTVYMQRDPRHDHGFVVPDPVGRAALGVPDPCGRCHADRDAAWLGERATAWYGDLAGDDRRRAAAVSAARAGDRGAVDPLLAMLTRETPGWRAAAGALLAGWVDEPRVRAALVAALQDPDGLVRFGAAAGLEPAAGAPDVEPALVTALSDPRRAVRVQAARALRHRLDPSAPEAAEYAAYLALNAASPSALHERGGWALVRGRVDDAIADLERAVRLDPGSVALRDTFAVALASAGRADEAAAQLREAVALDEDDAELWFRLGLSEAGRGDLAAAVVALERSAAVGPDAPRTWYNLGLVRQELGRGAPAVEALRRATALAPDDPEVGYGLASVLFRQGDRAGAQREAGRVLALAPGHPGATALLAAGG